MIRINTASLENRGTSLLLLFQYWAMASRLPTGADRSPGRVTLVATTCTAPFSLVALLQFSPN
jgi:uncharacterized protein YdaU (DUF1376 family)